MSKRHHRFGLTYGMLLVALLFVSCGNSSPQESSSQQDASSEEPYDVRRMATVRGKVLLDNGAMVTSGIIVENELGETYRTMTNHLSGYNLRLRPGSYKFHFVRGFEYSIVTKTLTVEEYKTYYIQDVRLIHVEDAFAKGWVAGDLHMHSYYSDGVNSVPDVLISNISNGLYYAFLSDHNTGRGLSEWTQGNRMAAYIDANDDTRMFNAYDAVEVTTEFGHYQTLGIGLTFDMYEVLLRESERVKSASEKEEIIKEKIRYIGETIKWAGGVAQINHPYSTSTMGFSAWDTIDAFDTLEIWNGYFHPGDGRYEPEQVGYQGQNYRSKMKWFSLLNDIKNGGHFLAATAGTDNHDISGPYSPKDGFDEDNIQSIEDYNQLFHKYGKYTGAPSTYVKIDGPITQTKVLNAIKNGYSFLTNGPLLYGSVSGKSYGETVTLTGSTATLNLEAFARDGFESIAIVKNGVNMTTFNDISGTIFEENIPLTNLSIGDWIVIEAFGPKAQYAISNPIFFSGV